MQFVSAECEIWCGQTERGTLTHPLNHFTLYLVTMCRVIINILVIGNSWLDISFSLISSWYDLLLIHITDNVSSAFPNNEGKWKQHVLYAVPGPAVLRLAVQSHNPFSVTGNRIKKSSSFSLPLCCLAEATHEVSEVQLVFLWYYVWRIWIVWGWWIW